ncbi:hypothetical protein HPB51_018777 [Rhipicephalus microplus]|uniref:Uncharacterized protein n=1 Tax=Rhipicephalus microplus TaxID=6941 RepID=A0A9J6DJ53_RHIMP|nr:hypothetical protein HPB51_018777 [Rhipicephalus microplus]
MERAAVRAALEAAAARAPVALCVREARVGVQGLPQRARAREGADVQNRAGWRGSSPGGGAVGARGRPPEPERPALGRTGRPLPSPTVATAENAVAAAAALARRASSVATGRWRARIEIRSFVGKDISVTNGDVITWRQRTVGIARGHSRARIDHRGVYRPRQTVRHKMQDAAALRHTHKRETPKSCRAWKSRENKAMDPWSVPEKWKRP